MQVAHRRARGASVVLVLCSVLLALAMSTRGAGAQSDPAAELRARLEQAQKDIEAKQDELEDLLTQAQRDATADLQAKIDALKATLAELAKLQAQPAPTIPTIAVPPPATAPRSAKRSAPPPRRTTPLPTVPATNPPATSTSPPTDPALPTTSAIHVKGQSLGRVDREARGEKILGIPATKFAALLGALVVIALLGALTFFSLHRQDPAN